MDLYTIGFSSVGFFKFIKPYNLRCIYWLPILVSTPGFNELNVLRIEFLTFSLKYIVWEKSYKVNNLSLWLVHTKIGEYVFDIFTVFNLHSSTLSSIIMYVVILSLHHIGLLSNLVQYESATEVNISIWDIPILFLYIFILFI